MKFLIEDNEIHLWKIPLNASREIHEQLFKYLSSDEIIRSNQFLYPIDRLYYINCRGSLRVILSKYTNEKPKDIIFTYNPYGKPLFLNTDKIHFNVSHSSEMALVAIVKNKNIGIDLECTLNKVNLDLIQRYLVFEKIFLNVLQDKLSKKLLLSIWTKYEARVKAKGKGLLNPLHDFFSFPCYEYTFEPDDHYVASLYVEGNIENLKRFNVNFDELCEVGL